MTTLKMLIYLRYVSATMVTSTERVNLSTGDPDRKKNPHQSLTLLQIFNYATLLLSYLQTLSWITKHIHFLTSSKYILYAKTQTYSTYAEKKLHLHFSVNTGLHFMIKRYYQNNVVMCIISGSGFPLMVITIYCCRMRYICVLHFRLG